MRTNPSNPQPGLKRQPSVHVIIANPSLLTMRVLHMFPASEYLVRMATLFFVQLIRSSSEIGTYPSGCLSESPSLTQQWIPAGINSRKIHQMPLNHQSLRFCNNRMES